MCWKFTGSRPQARSVGSSNEVSPTLGFSKLGLKLSRRGIRFFGRTGLPDAAKILWSHDLLHKQPEQGVDELARVFPAVFPAREGFLAAAEEVGELVLRKGKTFAQGPDIRVGKQAHVTGLGFVDEDGGLGSHHFVAEIIGVNVNLNGVHLDGRTVLRGGDVDVEGNLFGFHGRCWAFQIVANPAAPGGTSGFESERLC